MKNIQRFSAIKFLGTLSKTFGRRYSTFFPNVADIIRFDRGWGSQTPGIN